MVMFRILFGLIAVLIAAAAIAEPLAEKELLTIPTRFGTLTVTGASHFEEGDELTIVAHLGDQAIEVGTYAESASLDGLYQVPKGDLVLLDMPSRARGVP